MKIILKKDVDHLGFKYDLVDVKDGYASNYLIPYGYALFASKGAIKDRDEILAQKAKKEKILIEQAHETLNKIKGLSIKIAVKTGSSGKIFGSVGTQDILNVLKSQLIELDKKSIKIPGSAIKQIGKYKFIVRLHREVEDQIDFQVISLVEEKKEKK